MNLQHTILTNCVMEKLENVWVENKKESKPLLFYWTSECTMAQLGNTQVEDKKEKQVFRCTIELQKCTTLEPRNTLVQNKKKKKKTFTTLLNF